MTPKRYFATFITGCQEIVGQRLRAYSKKQLNVSRLQDGFVVFDSTLTVNQLAELRFFNAVYGLLVDARVSSINELADLAVESDIGEVPDARTFTVRAFVANEPSPADMGALKESIHSKTGALFTSHKPALTFVAMLREDGQGLFGWRLPAGSHRRTVEAGELRPELAHMLGLVASLKPSDKVLDPFAGHGAIARECLVGFNVRQMVAVETDKRLAEQLKHIAHLQVVEGDARDLSALADKSIDRVITDPPWGLYHEQPEHELEALYRDALRQMHRVLRTKGSAVVLTAAPFLPDLAAEIEFELEKEYPILVSGKKATIYRLRKK